MPETIDQAKPWYCIDEYTEDDLLEAVPRLQQLIDEASASSRTDDPYCAERAFLARRPGGSFRRRLERLVGWYSMCEGSGSWLETSHAWHLAAAAMIKALGPCDDACYGNE